MHRGVRLRGWAKGMGSVWAAPSSRGAGIPEGTGLCASRSGVGLSHRLGDGRKDGLPHASMRGERRSGLLWKQANTCLVHLGRASVDARRGGWLGLGPVVEIRRGGVWLRVGSPGPGRWRLHQPSEISEAASGDRQQKCR